MKKQDIICVSMTTWEGDYMKTIVHMMSQLAKNHRVLFVDYAFTWKDLIFTLLGKSRAPVGRMLGWSSRLRKLETRQGDEIYHLTLPPVIPINWIQSQWLFRFMLGLQVRPIASALRKKMNQLKFQNTVMINAFHPVMGVALAQKLEVAKTIYYCYDEIRAAQWAGVHGGNFEDQFIPMVDEVIVTSSALFQNRSGLHSNVSLIKNGVDFELFHQAYTDKKAKDSKVIGYLGSIDDRLDYELLEYLIKNHPDKEFHFVGRITYPAGQARLSPHKNVKFFGAQQPDQIPHFLKAFHVGIIPFAINEFTKNIYPLKINEYLAAGIPVVSTDFADLSDFADLVHITSMPETFGKAIEYALMDSDAMDARLDIAKSNGWNSRAAQLEAILDSLTTNPVHHD